MKQVIIIKRRNKNMKFTTTVSDNINEKVIENWIKINDVYIPINKILYVNIYEEDYENNEYHVRFHLDSESNFIDSDSFDSYEEAENYLMNMLNLKKAE